MNNSDYGIKKNFGFGLMRLPTTKFKTIDYKQINDMVDYFMANGFNYFDTAHGYMTLRSEKAVRKCISSRYKREDFILTNKLSDGFFFKQEDIRPLFKRQLKACGVEYFDFYLMHAQDRNNFKKYKKCRAYETALELLAEGKIKHLGISFHDKAEILDQILTEYPEVEVVQIQFNYLDYEDASVEARKCYEVCCKHGKPVIVMEPVKGGALIKLPEEGQKVFDELNNGSNASYAIRFAASFDNVFMVISGMGNMDMMRDNVSFMKEFKKLEDSEYDAINKVRSAFGKLNLIPCTGCRYCTDGCPKKIAIPDLFACLNDKKNFKNWNADYYYGIHTKNGGKASDCINCGKCEHSCPQHLEIRQLLKEVAKEFGK
ncbi:MAG: aldo/keto reductase [Clostridia bacterium]|nr:aldo/keto reductase [Clostridia bacterium]